MARIVFAWELGTGLGHVVRMKPIAERLLKHGHQVWAIVKDPNAAQMMLDGGGIQIVKAPIVRREFPRIPKILTFAHVLHNAGFGDAISLEMGAGAWRALFAEIKPDLVVCDHSPTALLAARGLPLRKVVIGTGFTCPALSTPMMNLRPRDLIDDGVLLRHEELLVQIANGVLSPWQAPPLDSVAALYREVDGQYLTTFAELDPYINRGPAEYWGSWSPTGGEPADWPPGEGLKLFAYLKPTPGIDKFLHGIAKRRYPMLAYGLAGSPQLVSEFEGTSVKIIPRPLDIEQVCASCDLAITNATHGTTAVALLAGKPQLMLPLYLEQGLTAERVVALGAGRIARATRPESVISALDDLVSSTGSGVRRIAPSYSRNQQLDAVAGRLDQMSSLCLADNDCRPL